MNTAELSYSIEGKRIWVAGHRGMVGSALLRRLKQEDCTLLTVGRDEVDLRRRNPYRTDWWSNLLEWRKET